jgi:hypothetical protein
MDPDPGCDADLEHWEHFLHHSLKKKNQKEVTQQ